MIIISRNMKLNKSNYVRNKDLNSVFGHKWFGNSIIRIWRRRRRNFLFNTIYFSKFLCFYLLGKKNQFQYNFRNEIEKYHKSKRRRRRRSRKFDFISDFFIMPGIGIIAIFDSSSVTLRRVARPEIFHIGPNKGFFAY